MSLYDDENLAKNRQFQALLGAYDADPNSYRAIYDLGMFMSDYRVTAVNSLPLLLQAFQMAPTNQDKAALLLQIYVASGYAGDTENEFKSMQALAKYFPGTLDYQMKLSALLVDRGKLDEASLIINSSIHRNYQEALRIMRERRYERPVQFIADPDELFDAFGELAVRFDMYVKARILGITPKVRAFCRTKVSSPGAIISNPALLEIWRSQVGDHIEFVEALDDWKSLVNAHPGCGISISQYRLADGLGTIGVPARTYILKRWQEEGREPVIRLPDEIESKGRDWLESLGFPKDAWFVCLHLRDGGYKADPEGSINQLRNSRMSNYISAIEEIVRRGGWVIRIGNPSPQTMPSMQHTYDYANGADHADWKDLFLLSKCRFFLGSGSGPAVVAQVFGVPVVMVDIYPIGNVNGARKDVLVHKLLRRADTGTIVPIREAVVHPLGVGLPPDEYARRGFVVEDNSPDDIRDAVIEMLERIEGRWVLTDEDKQRQLFYDQSSPVWRYGTVGNLSRAFLDRHPELLGGGV